MNVPTPPDVVVIDLRAERRAALNPEWEWIDVSPLGDPPWIRRYAPGRWKGPHTTPASAQELEALRQTFETGR